MRKPRDLALDLSHAKVLTIKLPPFDVVEPARPGVHVLDVPGWRPATLKYEVNPALLGDMTGED